MYVSYLQLECCVQVYCRKILVKLNWYYMIRGPAHPCLGEKIVSLSDLETKS